MIRKVIFKDLHNAGGNAGMASVRFYDENGEVIESGNSNSQSNASSTIAKYDNMKVMSDYFKTTRVQTGSTNEGKPIYTTYTWVVDRAFKTSNPISNDNCWISDQVNTFDTLKIEFTIPVYKISQVKFITSNEGVGGNAPNYKITQPFYIEFYNEMNGLIKSYEVMPSEDNLTSLQTLITKELNPDNKDNDIETIWRVWIRPFRLVNDQVVFYNGAVIYGPTPAVCPPCDTSCPSYDVMLSNLEVKANNLDFWMLYDSFSNSTNSLEEAKKIMYDLITINGYDEKDIMITADFPIRIGMK